MFYTVYKITNKVNGKIYIGVHKTSDLSDGYMGSGKMIIAAIKKYGLENFDREYLKVFDNSEDMFNMESELVNEEFVSRDDTYNLKIGGEGGFSFINTKFKSNLNFRNEVSLNISKQLKIYYSKHPMSNETKQKIALRSIGRIHSLETRAKIGISSKARTHSDETKAKMSEKAKLRVGEKNSSYGSMWIMNSETHESKKIQKTDEIPVGWIKGRKIIL